MRTTSRRRAILWTAPKSERTYEIFNRGAAFAFVAAAFRNSVGARQGVARQSAASGTTRAGLLATRLAANASKDQTPHLRVFGFVRFESYGGSANSASPLFLRSNGTSVAFQCFTVVRNL